MSVAIDISQLLYNKRCTYSETKEILSLLKDQLATQQAEREYNTVDDFRCGKKSRDCDNSVIRALQHVPGSIDVDPFEGCCFFRSSLNKNNGMGF